MQFMQKSGKNDMVGNLNSVTISDLMNETGFRIGFALSK